LGWAEKGYSYHGSLKAEKERERERGERKTRDKIYLSKACIHTMMYFGAILYPNHNRKIHGTLPCV
jgi:hypothetical protein